MRKKLSFLVVILIMMSVLSGCGLFNMFTQDMPFNGEIQFHSITAVIPDDFIRDTTQSNEDLWVFEKNNYKQIIIISRTDADDDPDAGLDDYVELMTERGATASRETFLDLDAVMSTYYLEEVYCQEIMFLYNNSYYAFALRGGTEEEFQNLLNDLIITDAM